MGLIQLEVYTGRYPKLSGKHNMLNKTLIIESVSNDPVPLLGNYRIIDPVLEHWLI